MAARIVLLDGERMLEYARRIVRLNNEAMAMFHQPDVAGLVRLGTPEDYADRFRRRSLPASPRAIRSFRSTSIVPAAFIWPSEPRRGDLDLALLTVSAHVQADMIVRTERLVWVTSIRHNVQDRDVLPVALSSPFWLFLARHRPRHHRETRPASSPIRPRIPAP